MVASSVNPHLFLQREHRRGVRVDFSGLPQREKRTYGKPRTGSGRATGIGDADSRLPQGRAGGHHHREMGLPRTSKGTSVPADDQHQRGEDQGDADREADSREAVRLPSRGHGCPRRGRHPTGRAGSGAVRPEDQGTAHLRQDGPLRQGRELPRPDSDTRSDRGGDGEEAGAKD